MKSMEVIFARNKIVPVVVINDVEAAIPLAETLLAAGINNMEVTLRTANALEVIRKVAQNVPEMVIGAGTILTVEHFKQAQAAGAERARGDRDLWHDRARRALADLSVGWQGQLYAAGRADRIEMARAFARRSFGLQP